MEETEKQEREDRFVIIRFDILTNKNLTQSEKLVYARICGFKKYFESKEVCSEMLGVSKDTVIKAKQKLLKLGYIRELENTGRGKIYQPVYDIETRVVKSTSQSGKKLPVRVVKSTTIEERESKERVNSVSSNEELAKANSESFSLIRKKASKGSRVSKNLSECKNPVEKNTPPKNSAKSPPTSLALAYKFCTEFKLPIMNNTVFKSKMKALSKLMDDDSEKIDMYFATLAKLQDQECIDDPFCPKVYNALDIYSKYNNVRTYYASKMKEAVAKMSTVEELMNKQAGRQWEI